MRVNPGEVPVEIPAANDLIHVLGTEITTI